MAHRPVSAYPAPEQAERWFARAEELDMGHSEFLISMVEAGMKKFAAARDPPAEIRTLREKSDHLRGELTACREERERVERRMRDLEEHWLHTDRATAAAYISENPGATYDEVLDHVQATAPVRLSKHLDALEGDGVRVEVDDRADSDEPRRYYPAAAGTDRSAGVDGGSPTGEGQ